MSKLKRFLSTLQQFGNDISRDVGERVHSLILCLVNSAISIEEFHQRVQDIMNCPLRPFVVPFLKSHLPILQNEIIQYARLAKQTPQQYLRQYEQAVLDSESHPSGEPFEIFQSNSKETRKRCMPSTNDLKRPRENGYSETRSNGPSPVKRHHNLSNPPFGSGISPNITANHEKCSFSFDDSINDVRAKERDLYEKSFQREPSEEKEMEGQWRNIYTMLNCILGMVDKTKRALTILQQRSCVDWTDCVPCGPKQMDSWEMEIKRQSNDIMTHCKSAEDRVSEVRRKAEEAVNEVKQQAVAELQRAVSLAETKASEFVAEERAKLEQFLSETRRKGSQESLSFASKREDSREMTFLPCSNQQDDSIENCWNCGRKANETCSGCNVARYCGTFCQHKDWETHHRRCGKGVSGATPSVTVSCTPLGVAKTSTKTPICHVSSTNFDQEITSHISTKRTDKSITS
ncbi:protein CBFA2T3-like isoform X3 [Tachypleus tridentatus]